MYDDTECQIRRLLPAPQCDWFLKARELYLKARHRDALRQDVKLLEWAEAEGHQMGQILGHRFVGLCHFRLEELDDSERCLRHALSLAEDLTIVPQVLLCANHLGATLRKKGLLLEAYDLFKKYLLKATLPSYLHERARLYGNFGALLDQLGQRAAADDYYARMEELCELLDNADRLANARGLAARSAEFREDWDTARTKYEEERDLAIQSKNSERQIAATLHLARMSAQRERYDEAEDLCNQALAAAEKLGHESRRLDVMEYRGEILQLRGRLAASYQVLYAAYSPLRRVPDHAEKRANLARRLSKLCCDAGLHGDALYYLAESAESHLKLFAPLHKNPQVQKMAHKRLLKLQEVARELAQEARSVARPAHERDSLKQLLRQILSPSDPNISDEKLEQMLGSEQPEYLSRWPQLQNEKATKLWDQQLLPGSFMQLHPESRKDLVRAEISYSATVSDLPRFAHLLAIVVERELRERIVVPVANSLWGETKQLSAWCRVSLGDILELLAGKLSNKSTLPDSQRMQNRIAQHLRPHQATIERVLRLRKPLDRADGTGKKFRLVDLRNAVAHGEDGQRFSDMNRMTVDAVKRVLVLDGDPPLLARIASLRLDPASLRRSP